jgi:hypothetical protein
MRDNPPDFRQPFARLTPQARIDYAPRSKNEKLTISNFDPCFHTMSTIEEIENAVEKLNKDELTSFRDWFAQHDAAQ